jgi:hypothetical protein
MMQRKNMSETLWKSRKKNLLNIWRDIQKETYINTNHQKFWCVENTKKIKCKTLLDTLYN